MVNRRMFRPGFPDLKEQPPQRAPHNGPVPSKKPAPPETTHAENFYWVKQMQSRTPMAIVLEDGEVVRGTIEWYDRDCIKRRRRIGFYFRLARSLGSECPPAAPKVSSALAASEPSSFRISHSATTKLRPVRRTRASALIRPPGTGSR